MAQTTVEGVEGVQRLVGQHLGHSEWVTITQEQVNQFADATGDHQWIHVDPAALRRLVVTADVDAALDACNGPGPGDGSRRGG